MDLATGRFVYVPIPESHPSRPGLERCYDEVVSPLARMGFEMPAKLRGKPMHLDPDFDHLTYGDQRQRGVQIRTLTPGDLLVFYAGLRAFQDPRSDLVYALIGVLEIQRLDCAIALPESEWSSNAHSRRELAGDEDDVVVGGTPGSSGRFDRALPIGERRDGAYRVRRKVLEAWGGLGVKDGFIQRSARLPSFSDPTRFSDWLSDQGVALLHENWSAV